MTALPDKLLLLDTLYRCFDEYAAANGRIACARGCAACCTHDLIGTTVEAWRLLEGLRKQGRDGWAGALSRTAEKNLFRPRVTTNTLALACLSRRDPPEETAGEETGVCPLLYDGLCSVYDDRPFACRSMFSQETCLPGGEGIVAPELLTVSAVCNQIIEHLDAGGIFGNIIDLALALRDEATGNRYAGGGEIRRMGHAPTKPVPGLLVPPEHQTAVQDFLNRLFQTDCGGQTFRRKMAEVRNSPF